MSLPLPVPAFSFWWATPRAAQDYRPDRLRAEDLARAGRPRAARAELDWRVSRSLLGQALPQSYKSDKPAALALSHRAGHALLAVAPPDWRVGVDLEICRPRDVDRLAEWCCSGPERAALAGMDAAGAQQWFYVLWTLKEAFVKAAGLDFPADMKTVGLDPGGGRWRLRAPAGDWQACSLGWDGPAAAAGTAPCGPGWVASAVWLAPRGAAAAPVWRAARGCAVPQARVLWQSPG